MGGFIGLCRARFRELSNLLQFYGFAGERTFGVLTKLDLMDKGTNALDVSASSLNFVDQLWNPHVHDGMDTQVICEVCNVSFARA